MKILTNSSLTTKQRCLAEYHIKHDLGWRPTGAAYERDFGTAWHRVLEVWYKSWQAGADEGVALAQSMAMATTVMSSPWDTAKLRALLTGYHARWSNVMDEYAVLAVEAEFDAQLVNPQGGKPSRTFRRAGKIDVILGLRSADWPRKAALGILIMEHKTTGADLSPGSDYWQRLVSDSQVSMYFDGADSLGSKPSACIYDAVKRPEQRQLCKVVDVKMTQGKVCNPCNGSGNDDDSEHPQTCKECSGTGWKETPRPYKGQRLEDETVTEYEIRVLIDIKNNPDKYFGRQTLVRLESELDQHRRDIWLHGVQLRECYRLNVWPRSPGSCVRFGRKKCSYFDVCWNGARLEGPRFKQGVGHPELENDEPENKQSTIDFDEPQAYAP